MSNQVCLLDQGPACEPDKLIVEIIGKDHADTQALLICDAAGQPLDAITAAVSEENGPGENVISQLKVWDWEEQPGDALYLEIATEEGAPIRLPLLTDLRATARQDAEQLNQILPVVPCTALPGIRNTNDLGMPVVVRSGYIYVFYQQKLWRELEVRYTDAGTRFFDIDVEHYREDDGFLPGKRTATGVALEDIWLPAQWNGRRAGPVQLMFSEIQLSAARLGYLESHETRLSPRTRSPNLLIRESFWEQYWADCPQGQAMADALLGDDSTNQSAARTARFRMELFAFPLNLCAPQRQRQPGHEWLLDQPARLLCDLNGQYPEQSMESTRATVERWRTGEFVDAPADFESEAWRSCYTCEEADEDAAALWQAQGEQVDTLEAVRERQIYGVLLPDAMNRMRHLHARIDSLQALLTTCTKLAIEHPHHASALLLHNLAVPPQIGGQRNPLHRSLQDKLDEDGKREINIATAAAERSNVWHLLDNAQQTLAAGLGSEEYQQCLADHLSQDGFDYQAAMFFAVRLLASIATAPDQLDPLALKGDIHDAVTGWRRYRNGRNPGQQLLTQIANRPTHPLHVMLWPEVNEDQLFVAYQRPAEEEPNTGNGRFRPTALASLEDLDAPDETSETLDGLTLAALMQSGILQDSFTVHGSFKAGMAVLTKTNEILNGAVKAAENHRNALIDQNASNNQTISQHQSDLGQARQQQSNLRGELGGSARVVDIRLHGMNAEHLRQTMPKAFEGARFVRAGNFDISDYYLFGLEDLPEVDPNAAAARFYGQYLDADGKPIAMTNARSARQSNMPIVPESGTYFAIPRNGRTAGIVRQLNEALNQELLVGTGLLAARANVEQLVPKLQRATENLRRAREGMAHRVCSGLMKPDTHLGDNARH